VAQSILELMNDEIRVRLEEKHVLRETPYGYEELTELTESIFGRRRMGEHIGLGIVIKDVAENDGRVVVEPNRGRGYDYCTMCSILPAIIHYHREVKHETPYLSRGEKLCPVCLFKRLVGVDGESLNKFVNIVFSTKGVAKPYLEVLSTVDVANRYLGEKIAEKLDSKSTPIKKDCKGLKGLLKKCKNRDWICRRDSGLIASFEDEYMPLGLITAEMSGKIAKEYRRLRCEWDKLFRCLGMDLPGGLYIYFGIFISDADRMGNIVSGELYRARVYKPRDPELYGYEDEISFYIDYIKNSLNIGDKNTHKLFISVLDAVKEVLLDLMPWEERDAKIGIRMASNEVLKKLVAQGVIGQKELNDHNYRNQLERLVYSILLFFYRPVLISRDGQTRIGFIYRPRVVPSPSYLVSISRSLMFSLLRDLQVVRRYKGIVIYAGGDDLLALLPLARLIFNDHGKLECVGENFLGAMMSIRKFYSNGDEDGFATIYVSSDGKYLIPMLYGLGRSQTLLMSHYREPMARAIQLAHELLDRVAKDGSRWRLENREGALYIRDGLVITSYSGGTPQSETVPVLPCMLVRDGGYEPIHKYLAMLYKYVYGGATSIEGGCAANILSRSFLRDYVREMVLIGVARELDGEFRENVIIYLLGRNIIKRDGNGQQVSMLAETIHKEILDTLSKIYHSDPTLEDLIQEWVMVTGETVEYEVTAGDMAIAMMLRMGVITRGVGS